MRPAYSIEYRASVKKDLRKIDKANLKLIVAKIAALASNPWPEGVVKLQGAEHLYRIRVGGYRIVYEIVDRKLIVIIIKVGHRSRVYK